MRKMDQVVSEVRPSATQELSKMKTQKRSRVTKICDNLYARGFVGFFEFAWMRFWMLLAGTSPAGRFASWLVTWFAPPYYDRWELRSLSPKGFVAPSATVYGKDIHLGPNIFIDDGSLICQCRNGGPINIAASATVARNSILQTARGGSISVGEKTVLQPHCLLSAAEGSIRIGADVGIGPYCAFYPHDHGTAAGQNIRNQPLVIKGDIVVEDGAWLGHGVTVLSGVRIGRGAVIGAGSTVASDVPDEAVASGVPARVFMKRPSPVPSPASKDSLICREERTGEDAS
jgi:carbonic anhydrase/acetyltransferase-like protein (isoleucine patch superfamily)